MAPQPLRAPLALPPLPTEPTVTVVLVNFRGADQTLEAIAGLETLDWPAERLEVIVVENGSDDGSVDVLRAAAPDAKLVTSDVNLGFAGGCNLGVRHATGDVVAFLNSDARPDPGWIRYASDALTRDTSIACVASKVLDWDGELVDYIDGALTWFGKGYKPFVGEPLAGLGSRAADVLFASGSAMFVRRDAFDLAEGFDEDFFMFYEDVDLGWRLNLLGYRVRYVPDSIAYHRHHGTVSKYGSFQEQYFLERNALFTLFKNLSDQRLADVLPATLALSIRRGVAQAGADSASFDYRSGVDTRATEEVSRTLLASTYAIDQFVEHLPALEKKRAAIQASRRRRDDEVWPLMRRTDVVSGERAYVEGYEHVVSAFAVTREPPTTRVLVITGDPIGVRMAGPAIRAWHMALALSSEHQVTLMTTAGLEPLDAPFDLVRVSPGNDKQFKRWEQWADVIVFQGHAMAQFPALASTRAIVVADIYDPMHLEQLEQAKHQTFETWQRRVHDAVASLNHQLSRGDFFLCASDRQRMLYLGQLAALGRLNPGTYEQDPEFRRLIDVVPFGLEAELPTHDHSVLKGVHPGIGLDDKVILWAGGLYNWFDPQTLIRAVADVSRRHPDVRLFFQGTKHPHPDVPEMEIVSESRELARELGVLDTAVFFNDSWVPYAERQNYLLEADLGVSTHHVHAETEFSFRTRILDYLWARLPMVVTEGDTFAELVASEGLGATVKERDEAALASAIERLLYDEGAAAAARDAIERVRPNFEWSVVLEPLVAFVRDASRAGDAGDSESRARLGAVSRSPRGMRYQWDLVRHYLRNGGIRVVLHKVLNRVRRRLAG